MPEVDPRVDAYIAKAPEFSRRMLERIRKSFHKGCPDVVETIKWSTPAFEHHGLLGSMAAFKRHVSYGFWRGKEVDDPEGLFVAVGDSSMCASKPASLAELPTQAVLASYVRRAAVLNEQVARGETPKKSAAKAKKRPAPRAPADLVTALAESPEARTTFARLAPSHKREYVEWIVEAKRDATRAKRIATAVEWLAEGKRRNWKYERKS